MSNKKSLEEIFAQLTDEQKAMFRNCQSMDEIIALANESDHVLSDEELDFIASGGCGGGRYVCGMMG
jgi:hypothetical protein